MATDTPLRLYNTLTREKAAFEPIDPANVRMYVCGPTVYDYAHIGNARPVIVFDVLFRLLRHLYGAEHVTYVRNITDVDDKINARAARDFPGLPLNEAIRRVTEKTAAQFEKDAAALGCLPPTVEPRATDNIEQMIILIQGLLDRGHAYAARGEEGREVLFDILSMPDYGKLSRRPLEDQRAGARVAIEAHKRNPGDFVLWKESAVSEPGWPAAFRISEDNQTQLGLNSPSITIHGRPGWHIECSAMSGRYLGETFDIHGGGLDLIFPHHENEIAQSRCAHGTPVMANVWMHNGFLQVEGQKMSKSLGNFVTIHELLETEKFGGHLWLGEALRLVMLGTHYRQPIDWTVQALTDASDKLRDWATTILNSGAHHAAITRLAGGGAPSPDPKIIAALSDDLNTPLAITLLDQLHEQARQGREASVALLETAEFLGLFKADRLSSYFPGIPISHGAVLASPVAMRLLDDVRIASANGAAEAVNKLAVRLSEEGVTFKVQVTGAVSYTVVPTKDWSHLIQARLKALNARDFAQADAIRAELLEKGIQLMDYKDPATGERRTKWEVKR